MLEIGYWYIVKQNAENPQSEHTRQGDVTQPSE